MKRFDIFEALSRHRISESFFEIGWKLFELKNQKKESEKKKKLLEHSLLQSNKWVFYLMSKVKPEVPVRGKVLKPITGVTETKRYKKSNSFWCLTKFEWFSVRINKNVLICPCLPVLSLEERGTKQY